MPSEHLRGKSAARYTYAMTQSTPDIAQLQANLEAAQERLHIARTEGDHEDQIRGLMHEVLDARNALREAGRAALAPTTEQRDTTAAILAMLRQRAAVTELTLNDASTALIAAERSGNGVTSANLEYRAAYAAAMEAGDAYHVAVRLAAR